MQHSRIGDRWDYAVVENRLATLKSELVADADWTTRDESCSALFGYIGVRYNRDRRHSSLAYRSPAQYEREMTGAA